MHLGTSEKPSKGHYILHVMSNVSEHRPIASNKRCKLPLPKNPS